MATKLRLKSQKYQVKEDFSYSVDVLVNHGIPNFSNVFSYNVPEKLRELKTFSLVSVPFRKKNVFGIVLSRKSNTDPSLKSIAKVIYPSAVLTQEQMNLLHACMNRWGGFEWDFLPYFIPQGFTQKTKVVAQRTSIARKVVRPELKIGTNFFDLIELIEKRIKPAGQTLVVVPNLKILNFLKRHFGSKLTDYGSHLSQKERLETYLKILAGTPGLIVATRSGIFLPIAIGAEVIVVDDLDFSNYETRYPYWNVRDVALLNFENFSINFYAHSPSLELLRLEELGWLKISVNQKSKSNIFFSNNRISWQKLVSEGVRKGSVLVVIPERGYVNTIVCVKCRNIYRCACGGRLVQVSSDPKRYCYKCKSSQNNVPCSICHEHQILSYKKGIFKVTEELGRQFPGVKIFNSQISENLPKSGRMQIVTANYGQLPISDFETIVALNFEKYGYQGNLRSSELARKNIFDLLALGAKNLYLDVSQDTYFAQIALRNQVIKAAQEELAERRSLNLPPHLRMAKLECDAKFVEVLKEQNFIFEVQFVQGVAIIKFELSNGNKFIEFLSGVSKVRALKKLKPWKLEIDPLEV